MLQRLREDEQDEQDEQDDRYLLFGEKLARALAMLPLAAGPLLAMVFRSHLPIYTAGFAAVLVAWFLISTALLAAVVVRTRQRARGTDARLSGPAVALLAVEYALSKPEPVRQRWDTDRVNKRRTASAVVAGVVAAATITVGVAAAPAAAPASACEAYPDARTPEVARELCGPVLQHYVAAGGPGSIHGLPTSDETPTSSSSRRYGDREVRFANGTIIVDTRTGETSSTYWERGT